MSRVPSTQVGGLFSPYRADTPEKLEAHITYARHLFELMTRAGFRVRAPHLLYTQVLVEENPRDRELGINMGLEDIPGCHVAIVGDKLGYISSGMEREIAVAKACGVPLVFHSEVSGMDAYQLAMHLRIVARPL